MALPKFKKPDQATTERMRKVQRRGTDLERATALILRREGLKYRSQPKIRGNPDFRIVGTKIVIFCDSSFWHGRWLSSPQRSMFHKNKNFWKAKLLRNRARDRATTQNMRERGWIVLRFWGESILGYPNKIISRIRRFIPPQTI